MTCGEKRLTMWAEPAMLVALTMRRPRRAALVMLAALVLQAAPVMLAALALQAEPVRRGGRVGSWAKRWRPTGIFFTGTDGGKRY